jgi:type VI secretion system protein ImpH
MRDPLTTMRRIGAAAARFEFIAALRLIEAAYRDKPRIGRALRVADEPLRLSQNADLAFRGKEITGAGVSPSGGVPRVAVNTGLLGPQGPMPLHFTEYVRERWLRAGDATWTAFLDVFHHRMLSLLYRARVASEPVIALDRPDDDAFARSVGSLAGFGRATRRDGTRLDARALLYFGGLLTGRTRHASGLATLLATYFGVPVSIEQFAGRWVALPDEALAPLGSRAAVSLGRGHLLGRRIWDRQHGVRIVIGPVDDATRRVLEPGTPQFAELVEWVRLYTGGMLDWDVEIRLNADVPVPMRLARNTRLARETWLGRSRSASHGGSPSLHFRGDVATPCSH